MRLNSSEKPKTSRMEGMEGMEVNLLFIWGLMIPKSKNHLVKQMIPILSYKNVKQIVMEGNQWILISTKRYTQHLVMQLLRFQVTLFDFIQILILLLLALCYWVHIVQNPHYLQLLMGKKIRYQYLTGSLLKPQLRYTQKLQIAINPISDPKGTKLAKLWHQMGTKSQPQFKLPNFECSMVQDYKSSTSYLVAEFINGWQHGVYLKGSSQEQLNSIFDQINEMIEFQRSLQGHDDQYEDEA